MNLFSSDEYVDEKNKRGLLCKGERSRSGLAYATVAIYITCNLLESSIVALGVILHRDFVIVK